MASSVVFEEQIEIPMVRSLAEFRAWATSDDFPERGRIDFLAGRIEVDMSPEDLFCHGTLKTEIVQVVGRLAKASGSGYLFGDRARVSSPEGEFSAEPDVVFLSHDSLESGRVRLVPKASAEPDRYVELEGPPDLIVEIVSDASVTKDTQRLPAAYWRAAVEEFWLVDARREALLFQIHRRGPSAYEAIAPDEEGFQHSAVFKTHFRLARRRNQHGRWVYDLEERHA
jgi:Uma2 family endonuclease